LTPKAVIPTVNAAKPHAAVKNSHPAAKKTVKHLTVETKAPAVETKTSTQHPKVKTAPVLKHSAVAGALQKLVVAKKGPHKA